MFHLIEPLFDVAYLFIVMVLGFRLLLEQNSKAERFGIMALILAFGDAFHLLPRVISHLTPDGFIKNIALLSWGQFVTSITMTIFYILLYHHFEDISNKKIKNRKISFYILAVARVILILMPQNMWGTEGSYLFGIIRNIPFTIMGILFIIWIWKFQDKPGLKNMGYLVSASFLFYLPVVVGGDFVPLLGALMIPKTIAYVLIIVSGYRYFIPTFRIENLPKLATCYMFMGLIGGVFYREFTKFYDWRGITSLRVLHFHQMLLGFIMLLIMYLLLKTSVSKIDIRKPLYLYLSGLTLMIVTFYVRGIYDITSSSEILFPDAVLSGIAGIGHVLCGVGFVMLTILFSRKLSGKLPLHKENM